MKLFNILLPTVILALVGCATQTQVADTSFVNIEREPASDCANGKAWKCKEARRNDLANQYMLDDAGNFYRYFSDGKQLCQITNDVKDFKISQHPNDAAVAYYESKNSLWVINNQDTTRNGNCPKVAKKVIMQNVKEWKVMSNTNTTIVNAAVDESGNFNAWDNIRVVYSQKNVIDFQMNSCFNVSGKSFSSYALFTLDSYGDVNKIKVNGTYYVSDASKIQRGNWRSLTDWKNDQHVCQ